MNSDDYIGPCDLYGCHGMCSQSRCRLNTTKWWKISQSNFSEVYTDTERRVAVKRYYTCTNREDVEDFHQEAKVLRLVRGGPHVITTTSICDRCFQIWMPFYPYTLYSRDKVVSWSDEQRRYALGCVAKALCYAHSVGVVHCDIKRANVLTNADATDVVLSDWNSARTVHEIGESSFICCQPQHCSPEVLMKRKEYYGPKMDVWAFGVLCYDVIANQTWAIDTIDGIDQFLDNPHRLNGFADKPWVVELLTEVLVFDHEKRPDMKTVVDKWFTHW